MTQLFKTLAMLVAQPRKTAAPSRSIKTLDTQALRHVAGGNGPVGSWK